MPATGDGIIAALQMLSLMLQRGERLSQCGRVFTPMPQILRNIRYKGVSPLGNMSVQSAINTARAELADKGRILVRASGTEPLIRVMVEAEDETRMEAVAEALCRAVSGA